MDYLFRAWKESNQKMINCGQSIYPSPSVYMGFWNTRNFNCLAGIINKIRKNWCYVERRGEDEEERWAFMQGASFRKKICKPQKGMWKIGWQYLVGRQGQHAPACRAALHGGEGGQHKK